MAHLPISQNAQITCNLPISQVIWQIVHRYISKYALITCNFPIYQVILQRCPICIGCPYISEQHCAFSIIREKANVHDLRKSKQSPKTKISQDGNLPRRKSPKNDGFQLCPYYAKR